MSAIQWALSAAAIAAILAVSAAWIWTTRTRQAPTTADQLAAAKRATRALRREAAALRPSRRHFEDGDPAADRYGGAMLENATYGDASSASD